MTSPTFSQWLAFMADGMTKQHDVVMCIDAKKSWLYGKVGSGKSNIGLVVAKALNPMFEIRQNVVIKDDLAKFEDVAYMKVKYFVKFVDETHHFFGRGAKQLTAPAERIVTEFDSNRKELGIWILCTPWMGRLRPEISEDGRVTYRLRMDPTLDGEFNADLFINNGHVNWEHDEYGQHAARFTNLPLCPPQLWTPYIAEFDAHDCRTRGTACMSNYRGSKAYRRDRDEWDA